jgi:hypothetical protein
MKRTLAVFCSILFSGALALGAQGFDYSTVGLVDNGERTIDGRTYTSLNSEETGDVLLGLESDLSTERATALKAIATALRSWKSFTIAEIRAINFPDRLQIGVITSKFDVGDTNLQPAVPGGIQLYYSGLTEYDFKVKSGQFILRVRGVLTGEDDLVAAAEAAYKDPVAFLEARDPAYLLKRIVALDERAAALDEKASALDEQSTALDEKAKALDERLAALEGSVSAIDSSAAANDGSTATLADRFAALVARLDAVEPQLAALEGVAKANAASAAAEVQKTNVALMAALNGGKLLSDDLVTRILTLKRADMTLDKIKLAAKLKEQKDLKVQPTTREIEIVLLVQFGEH